MKTANECRCLDGIESIIKTHREHIQKEMFIATRKGDEPIQVTKYKYCEMSGQYGKDNDKNLHFYCYFCGNEMGYDEQGKICTARTRAITEEAEFTPKSLADKFKDFRSKSVSGKGKKYWEGLEKIAEEHYT